MSQCVARFACDHKEDHRGSRTARGRTGTQVESEANQYIPFALEEVNLDFQVVGQAPSSPSSEVLIAASVRKKSKIVLPSLSRQA